MRGCISLKLTPTHIFPTVFVIMYHNIHKQSGSLPKDFYRRLLCCTKPSLSRQYDIGNILAVNIPNLNNNNKQANLAYNKLLFMCSITWCWNSSNVVDSHLLRDRVLNKYICSVCQACYVHNITGIGHITCLSSVYKWESCTWWVSDTYGSTAQPALTCCMMCHLY